MSKFAIIIPTYQKSNGETPRLLTRALNSIHNQSHKDWKIFLIGDRYEDNSEFTELSTIIDTRKIEAVNRLDCTIERDIYPMPSRKLWCAAGGSSMRYGITSALKQGYEYICKLDHDDFWEPDHLHYFNTAIENYPELFLIAARSNYRAPNARKLSVLPGFRQKPGLNYLPKPEKVINSAVCVKYSETDIRSRDVFAETGKVVPGDADLWRRLSIWMKQNKKAGYLVDNITCNHLGEGSALG